MPRSTIYVAIACLALGTGLGWMLADRSAPDAPLPDEGTPEAGAVADDAPALDSARALEGAMRADLDAARTTIGDLTKERDALRDELDQLKADAEAGRLAGGAERSEGVRFGGGRFKTALESGRMDG